MAAEGSETMTLKEIEEELGYVSRQIHPSMIPKGKCLSDYRPEQIELATESEQLDLTDYVQDPAMITPETELMRPWGEGIWIVDGPDISVYGCPYTTRMVVVRMQSAGAWLWSPIPYTEELAREIEGRCGRVRFIVAPNQCHHLHIKEWSEQYPQAKIHAPPGLPEREDIMGDLTVDFLLTEDAPNDCFCDVDACLFRGSYCDEAVFFHKASQTVIFADLIQRHYECKCDGAVSGTVMQWNNIVGSNGGTPPLWKFSWWYRGEKELARNALSVVLNKWKPEKLIVAHGECSAQNATEIVAKALSWINN